MLRLAGGLAGAVLGLKFLGDSLRKLGVSAVQTSQNQMELAKTVQLSVEQQQRWTHLARAAGVAPDAILGDLSAMSLKLERIKLGLDSPSAFLSQFPLSGSPEAVARTFAEKSKNLSAAQTTALAEELGLSQKTVYALREYGARLDDNIKLISEDQAQALQRVNSSWNLLGDSISRLSQSVGSKIAPAVSSLLDNFTKDIDSGGWGVGLRASGLGAISDLASLLAPAVQGGANRVDSAVGDFFSSYVAKMGSMQGLQARSVNITQNIVGTADPKATAEATYDKFRRAESIATQRSLPSPQTNR
jgi:hypothetical protein